jgi:hypothetical protein
MCNPWIAIVAVWTIFQSGNASVTRPDVPDAAFLEAQILASRRSIKIAEYEIDSKVWAVEGGNKTLSHHISRHVWLDEGKFRQDITFGSIAGKGGRRELSIYSEGWHTMWTDEVLPGGGKVAIHQWAKPQEEVDLSGKPIDLRMLGAYPVDSSNLQQFGFESLVSRSNKRDTQVRADSVDGSPCWRVEYLLPNGVMASYQVAPDKGYSVLSTEHRIEVGGRVYGDKTRSEVFQDAVSGCWVPTKVTFLKTEDGKSVLEEVATVRVISINRPIDPASYTLVGAGIPVGTTAWNGKSVVALEEGRFTEDDSDASRRKRRVYIIMAIVMGVLATVLSIRVLKRARG